MKGIRKMLDRIRLRLMLRMNPTNDVLKNAIEYNLEYAIISSKIISEKKICPPQDIIEKLAERGLYEPIISMAVSGCSVDSSILMDAFRFFALEGASTKAKATADLIGLKLPEPQSLVLYCSKHRRIIDWDGFIIDSRTLPRDATSRILSNAISELGILKDAWKSPILKWGCPIKGIDASKIARIVMPDVQLSISSLSYNLDEDPTAPTRVLRKLASFFLEVGDKVWLLDGVPQEYKDLEVFRGITKVHAKRCVIVTDRPKASIPLIKPYKINIEELVGKQVNDHVLSLRMLDVRMGDPARAYYYSMKYGEDGLRSLIAKTLTPRKEPEPLPPCIQIEPQDLGWLETVYPSILEEREVIIDCIKPTIECIKEISLNKYEKTLIEHGIHIPRPKKVNGKKLRAVSRNYIPESISVVTGVTSYNGGYKIRSIVNNNGKHDLASSIMDAVKVLNESGLIIVPNSINIEVSRLLNLNVLDEDNIDEWLDSGGVAVASWDLVKERPDVLYSSMGSVVSIYPESIIRSKSLASMIKDNISDSLQILEDTVIEMIVKLGGTTVSRTARFMDNIEVIKLNNNYNINVIMDRSVVMRRFEDEFKKLWGEDLELRKHQKATLSVISDLYSKLKRGIVLSVYPTGSGKSAIYQVAGRVATTTGYGSYTLVISPLRALINDQIDNAVNRGLIAYKIDSTVNKIQKRLIIDSARKGLIDLLYITPERFQDPELDELLNDANPSLIVLDEAHTLSSWGNTFRPGYLYMAKRLYEYTLERNWPPIALFTATAPRSVVKDIMESLGVERYVEYDISQLGNGVYKEPVILKMDPIREELLFDIEPVGIGEERLEQLVKRVKELSKKADAVGRPWVGIVFTGYVKSEKNPWANVNYIASIIRSKTGYNVSVYHGQMSNSERRKIENKIRDVIKSGGSMILVTTKAFGMGVDIPVIRWIIHVYPSDSPEDFYQEAGRAGRDGNEAWIVSMYNPVDFEDKKRLILMDRIRPSSIIQAYNMLVRLVNDTKYRGREPVILPTAAIAGGPASIKILDVLRSLGLLDYWITQTELTSYTVDDIDSFSDYSSWHWRLDKKNVISHTGIPRTKLWRSQKLRIEACTSNGRREIRIRAGDLTISSGPCEDIVWKYEGGKTQVAIIEFPIRKPKEIAIPSRRDFVKLVRRSIMDIESIDALKSMFESALAARSVGGQQAADKAIKEWIRKYFDEQPSVEESMTLDNKVHECNTLDRCIDDIVRTVMRSVRILGKYGVTVAVKDQDIAYRLKQELAARGVNVEPSIAAYRRVLSHSINPQKLVDNGYIIIVARENPQTINALSRLDEYPYKSVYIVKA